MANQKKKKVNGSIASPKTFKGSGSKLQFLKYKKPEFKGTPIPFLNILIISFILIIGCISMVLVLERNLPPEIPLFYGLPESEDQITSVNGLIIPSLISVAILVVNGMIAYLMQNEFLQKSLIIGGFVATLFSTITTIKIVLLVGSF